MALVPRTQYTATVYSYLMELQERDVERWGEGDGARLLLGDKAHTSWVRWRKVTLLDVKCEVKSGCFSWLKSTVSRKVCYLLTKQIDK